MKKHVLLGFALLGLLTVMTPTSLFASDDDVSNEGLGKCLQLRFEFDKYRAAIFGINAKITIQKAHFFFRGCKKNAVKPECVGIMKKIGLLGALLVEKKTAQNGLRPLIEKECKLFGHEATANLDDTDDELMNIGDEFEE